MEDKTYYTTDPEKTKRADALTEYYYKGIYKMAWSYLRDDHMAEDCARDVINKIAKRNNIRGEIGEDEFTAYVYRAARNTIINILERNQREVPSGLSYETILDCRTYHDEYEIFKGQYGFGEEFDKYLSRLKEIDIELLVKKFAEDKTIEVIAAEVNMSKDAVAKRLQRAVKKLARMMKNEEV